MTNPLAHLVFGQDFAMIGPGADDKVKPTQIQYDIKPGDYAVALTSDSVVDKEVSLLQVVDAESHKGLFPDFEERLMKSFVLCDWLGQMDQVPALGWFARSRLLPLTKEEHDELKEGFANKEVEAFPDWLMEKFRVLTDELSEHQPDMIHKRATCGKCGGRKVKLHWSVEFIGHADATVVQDGGKEIYVPNDEDMRATWQAHLHCEDCKATGTLAEEEFQKPAWMHRLA